MGRYDLVNEHLSRMQSGLKSPCRNRRCRAENSLWFSLWLSRAMTFLQFCVNAFNFDTARPAGVFRRLIFLCRLCDVPQFCLG